jgi:dihydroorotate dehydrogenase electron transfer subunit
MVEHAENPLHARHYADHAAQVEATIAENVQLARDTFRVRFDCPTIAKRITPGQFIMLRLADCDDPLLARPLALYDTVMSSSGEPIGLDIVYLVAGKFTRRLATCPVGQQITLWGPLGNGFPPQTAAHLIMVAGGIGQTPFMALAAEHRGLKQYGDPRRTAPRPKQITFCYGARSADYLAGVDDFRNLGIDVHISTDDGTAGKHGFVTELFCKALDGSISLGEKTPHPGPFDQTQGRPLPEGEGEQRQIVCCGPERMMEAVAKIAQERNVPCQLSLETPMACGIGICFTCVAKIRQSDGGWDYKRTCVEGPIFNSADLVW